jgi:4-oxalocrotonate tautomerase
MPLVRIDLDQSAPAERGKVIGNVVYDAMISVVNVPLDDRFQIVTRHDAGDIVYPEGGYLGVSYTNDLVIIQITWNQGRSIETKKAFFKQVADGVAEKTGMRREDVGINLVEVAKENWSFGNGEMQYGPK